MFEDHSITLRKGIIMLPRFNRTIVARCDLGLLGFVDPQGKMTPSALPRVPFSPSCVQNAMDLSQRATACNNWILGGCSTFGTLVCRILFYNFFFICVVCKDIESSSSTELHSLIVLSLLSLL